MEEKFKMCDTIHPAKILAVSKITRHFKIPGTSRYFACYEEIQKQRVHGLTQLLAIAELV